MIYYKISYYIGEYLLAGQFLEEWQLKCVKNLVNLYLELYKKINVRMKIVHNPSPIKSNLEVQEIEVF